MSHGLAVSAASNLHEVPNPWEWELIATVACVIGESISFSLTVDCKYRWPNPKTGPGPNPCYTGWSLDRLDEAREWPGLLIATGSSSVYPASDFCDEFNRIGLNPLEFEIEWPDYHSAFKRLEALLHSHHLAMHRKDLPNRICDEEAAAFIEAVQSSHDTFDYGEWKRAVELGGPIEIYPREISLSELLASLD